MQTLSEFFDAHSAGLLQLANEGYSGYIQFECWHDGAGDIESSLYLTSEVVAHIAKLSLEITFWNRQIVLQPRQQTVHSLTIPEPPIWYSEHDEAAFFKGLEMESIVQVDGGYAIDGLQALRLSLNKRYLSDLELSRLIGLLWRYQLPMTCLQDQCGPHNKHWLKQSEAYWFAVMFGDS